jgi:hypothetical protein
VERTPPKHLVEAIGHIAPGLYPRWFPGWERWLIVKDWPRLVPGMTEYDAVAGKHYMIELVLEDENGQALELDTRVVETVGKLVREKERLSGPDGFSVEKFCKEMDDQEDIEILKARKVRDEAIAEFFKTLWRHEHQMTFS